jgi:hypothetical protein
VNADDREVVAADRFTHGQIGTAIRGKRKAETLPRCEELKAGLRRSIIVEIGARETADR